MNQLVKDLLDYSRIGRLQEKVNINLNDLLRVVQYELRDEIASTGAEMKINDLPNIYGVRSEIKTLWLNLLSNALKFTISDQNPVVVVTYEKSENDHIFCVKDNGIGIDPKFMKIFSAFSTDFTIKTSLKEPELV